MCNIFKEYIVKQVKVIKFHFKFQLLVTTYYGNVAMASSTTTAKSLWHQALMPDFILINGR